LLTPVSSVGLEVLDKVRRRSIDHRQHTAQHLFLIG